MGGLWAALAAMDQPRLRLLRLRRWQSASASWLTSLVGRVCERGGPRLVRWETGAGARGAKGRPSARPRGALGGRSPVGMEVQRETGMGVAAIIS